MTLSRRRLVLAGTALAGAAAFAARSVFSEAAGVPERSGVSRRIELYNLHTDEHLDVEYFSGDSYLSAALARVQVLLRDFRNGEQHPIEPQLLDNLVAVAGHLGRPPSFSVVSGYRSPHGNEHMHGLHVQGRAVDVRMSGVDCDVLAIHARNLKLGGVGYYRAANFVHLDTGAFRTWNG
jgi:uncharacterized protein YcbK (DUF882 family)